MTASTVLVVDDNEVNRYLLRAVLEGHGFEVTTAAHGGEALASARRDPPDLIIADILMPVMDGFALCRAWKQDEVLRSIPFVFYTATYTDERDCEFGLSLGAARYLVKPQEPDELVAIIRETLEQASRRQGAPAITPDDPPAAPPPDASVEEAVFLKQYNEALVRKLERKMEELEAANRELRNDIAERRRAEEERARLASAIEQSPDGVVLADAAGAIVYVNASLETMIGHSRLEILGRHVTEFVSSEAARSIGDALSRGAGRTWSGELPIRVGRQPPAVEWSIAPVRSPLRTVVGYVAIARDRSAERALEAHLRQASRLEAVGRLAGGIAHDFNNLVVAIRGYSELVASTLSEADPRREDIEQVLLAADRAAGLTRQLLAFSRRQILKARVIDPAECIEGIVPLLRRLVGEDVELVVSAAEEIWNVQADPGQLEQVIVNLAVNARDAMPGGGRIEITLGNVDIDAATAAVYPGLKPGSYVRLAVADTGTGMSDEVIAHAFEPFFTTKSDSGGTGLGLASVYGIVKQSGGFVYIESEVGRGSTVTVYLPRVVGPATRVRHEVSTEPMPRGSGTIVLVEDNAAVRGVMHRTLESLGYQVLAAAGAAEALGLAADPHARIDALISDVVMPEMRGPALVAQMRESRPDLRVLFVSGHVGDSLVAHGEIEAADAFLAKPFTVAELARRVHDLLGG